MNQATDPFIAATDAVAADITVRRRSCARPKETVDLVGKPRQKKVDLNPVQRRWFEKHGYTYARVETANAWGGMTCDLWGCADYLACREGEIVLVQVTTAANAANRIRKARKSPELHAWFAGGGLFQVHSWKQPTGPGGRWENTVRSLTLGPDAQIIEADPSALHLQTGTRGNVMTIDDINTPADLAALLAQPVGPAREAVWVDYEAATAIVPDRLRFAVAACGIDLSRPLPAERLEVLACICIATPKYTRHCLSNLRRELGVRARPRPLRPP